jgi:transposase
MPGPEHSGSDPSLSSPKDGAIEMQLRARRSISTCPAYGTASRRVHSHYQRKLADLPWEGLPVVILLQARKFFCVGDSCRRKIFTEPLPGTVARYARRSCRSSEALHWLTLALGERAFENCSRTAPSRVEASCPGKHTGIHRFGSAAAPAQLNLIRQAAE